jgi:hypothetical protein
MGDYYINNDSQHQRNESLFMLMGVETLLQSVKLVVNGRKAKKKKKFVQFVAIFPMLKPSRPITNFEHMRSDFLNIHYTPKKHWTHSSGWDMAITMHNVIVKQIVLLVQHVRFLSISCDEVTIFDNQSWILFTFMLLIIDARFQFF